MFSHADSDRSLNPHASLRVLLVEDDELLRDHVLVPNLLQFGFDVVAIGYAAEVDHQIQQRLPDIVVLDVGLPDSDGFEVARQLRARFAGIGIIMLTARAETTDRIRGLSEGADAYLAKPIDIDLLAATLYSLARRLRTSPQAPAGHWHMDANGWCLLSPTGGVVALTQSEGRLLAPLMENANELISRDALIDRFAQEGIDFDSQRLDMLIHRLRKKVMQVLGIPLPLNAVHGKGYVLVSR